MSVIKMAEQIKQMTVYNMVCELIKLISTPYFLCLILGDKNEPIRYNGINNKQYAISK